MYVPLDVFKMSLGSMYLMGYIKVILHGLIILSVLTNTDNIIDRVLLILMD